MDDLYYQKYLKYKNKYLSLKQELEEQDGGAKMKTIFTVKAKVDGKEKVVEFGTLTDNRSIIRNRRFVKVGHPIPYLKMDKKEHEIIKAFGESDDTKIVSIIESKDISKLNEIIVHVKPCLTSTAILNRTLGAGSTCQKNRGILELNFSDVKLQ